MTEAANGEVFMDEVLYLIRQTVSYKNIPANQTNIVLQSL